MGSAQNPLSLNRFLYAHANPATRPQRPWSIAGIVRTMIFRSSQIDQRSM